MTAATEPAGFRVEDEPCDGCTDHHVTVWWTVTDAGRFRRYCGGCWERLVGVFK